MLFSYGKSWQLFWSKSLLEKRHEYWNDFDHDHSVYGFNWQAAFLSFVKNNKVCTFVRNVFQRPAFYKEWLISCRPGSLHSPFIIFISLLLFSSFFLLVNIVYWEEILKTHAFPWMCVVRFSPVSNIEFILYHSHNMCEFDTRIYVDMINFNVEFFFVWRVETVKSVLCFFLVVFVLFFAIFV